jgi:outer membrane protein assembly factor BamD (BamD/ComL family)
MASDEDVKGCLGCAAILVIAGVIAFFVFYIPKQRKAWDVAEQANTAQSYQKYLDDHSWGWYRSNARERIKQMSDEAWAKAQREKTPDAFNLYIKQFPQGEHTKEASDLLLKLHDVVWKELEGRSPPPTTSDYDSFVRNFPNSPHTPRLREQIQSAVWRILQTKSDAHAADFESYVQAYPNSPFDVEARERWHDLWWRELQSKAQSPDAYKRFVDTFPNSPHVLIARSIADGYKERQGTATSTKEVNRRMEAVQEFEKDPEQISTYESVYEKRPKPKGR